MFEDMPAFNSVVCSCNLNLSWVGVLRNRFREMSGNFAVTVSQLLITQIRMLFSLGYQQSCSCIFSVEEALFVVICEN